LCFFGAVFILTVAMTRQLLRATWLTIDPTAFSVCVGNDDESWPRVSPSTRA
jgi:hypothetical protein